MKKNSFILFVSALYLITFSSQNIRAESASVDSMIVSTVNQHNLETKILLVVEKYLPHFKDLTTRNLKTKFQYIELMIKEVLDLIKTAPAYQRKAYKELEKILTHFDLQKAAKAIMDFKKILDTLPKESSEKIRHCLQDPIIKLVVC
ncbi:hypothetical protein HYV11_03410 [Candidatus Dependentiae bacterium]|nr:hypothetical protein [Candidatus Dependentiae bacterium]